MPTLMKDPAVRRASGSSSPGGGRGGLAGAIWGAVGTVLLVSVAAFGFFAPLRVCTTCDGIGAFIVRCKGCQGDGRQTAWEMWLAGRMGGEAKAPVSPASKPAARR